jgi:hypothetical protein
VGLTLRGARQALATAPPGAPAKQSCPAGFDITGVDEWIQGETTPDAGALTAFFFFSQSWCARVTLPRLRCWPHVMPRAV